HGASGPGTGERDSGRRRTGRDAGDGTRDAAGGPTEDPAKDAARGQAAGGRVWDGGAAGPADRYPATGRPTVGQAGRRRGRPREGRDGKGDERKSRDGEGGDGERRDPGDRDRRRAGGGDKAGRASATRRRRPDRREHG